MMPHPKIITVISAIIRSALITVSAATMTIVLLLIYASDVDKQLRGLLNALLICLVVLINVHLVFLRKLKPHAADGAQRLDAELRHSDFALQAPSILSGEETGNPAPK